MFAKYKASIGFGGTISKELFDSETEKFLIRNGKRVLKESSGDAYFDTPQEAKGWLIMEAQKGVDKYKLWLAHAESYLEKVKAINLELK